MCGKRVQSEGCGEDTQHHQHGREAILVFIAELLDFFFFFNSTGVCIFSDKYFSKISHLKEGVAARNWFRTTEASKAMTFPAVEYSGSAMNMKLHKSY